MSRLQGAVMSVRGVMKRCCWVLVWLFALPTVLFAQSEPVPIQIGRNAAGTLSADSPTARYILSASGGETATIQVLSLSLDFVPRFRIINPDGIDILVVPNPEALASVSANASFSDAGNYLIEVSGENNTTGQFVLSLQPGATLPPAIELVAGQPIRDSVGRDAPVRVYHFRTTAAADILIIRSETPDTGTLVSLYDEDADKTIATHDANVKGIAYWLAVEHNYRAEVQAGGADDTAFSICLGNCGETLLSTEPTLVEVAETPEAVASGCTVASGTGGSVNVRSGPGTQYTIVGNLAAGGSLPALGQLAGGSWLQVSINGQIGWVAASVTRLDGDCGSLPVVAAPVGAQLAPTPAQPPTNPPPPAGGNAPSSTPTTAPTMTATTALLPDLTIIITDYHVDLDKELAAAISYTVSNIGSAPSEATGIMFCSGTYCDDLVSTGVLLPGEGFSGTVTFRHTADPNAAFNQATATVDHGNSVTESNEGNNRATAYE